MQWFKLTDDSHQVTGLIRRSNQIFLIKKGEGGELTFLRYLARIQRGETWRGVRFSTTGRVITCVDGSDDTTRTSSASTFLKCSMSKMSENSLLQVKNTVSYNGKFTYAVIQRGAYSIIAGEKKYSSNYSDPMIIILLLDY